MIEYMTNYSFIESNFKKMWESQGSLEQLGLMVILADCIFFDIETIEEYTKWDSDKIDAFIANCLIDNLIEISY